MPRDKSANHIKLMAAARSEFLEHGFEKASMRSIGERCGMTAALFEPVMHSYPPEDAIRCLDTIEAFFLPGWKKLMGF